MRTSIFVAIILTLAAGTSARADTARLIIDPNASPRVYYGAQRLSAALKAAGWQSSIGSPDDTSVVSRRVIIGKQADKSIKQLMDEGHLKLADPALHREGFTLATNSTLAVVGADDSGTLYGCLELSQRVQTAGTLPDSLSFSDAPVMVLRGPCIGMQKTYILPGRKVYEYPYTPELFPFFYDKAFWQEYLDFLADNRFNTLYLWNGHPFASLVSVPDYPYALEVPPDVFTKNQEMFRYIAKEADKRGIWVVQMFYNIFVSKPFAEKNGISTQLSSPTPLVADYTRKSLAEFVKQYPNVGLMICLGEALQGQDNQTAWLTQTILPGIKDGMAAAGLKDEPPVVIRTHATDLRKAMPEALKVYHNLYTEAKYSGESLTTSEPRGKWQQIHLDMSKLGSTHMVNIHILSNLEPFRYGDQQFIQKCVQAARDRLGAKGVHLYPLSYWNWPDSPDKVQPPLSQIHRDWIWFEAWARYSWNPDIDASIDHAYWVNRLASMYGSTAGAEKILAAYNDSGECAPRLIRRFGITEGNRETLSLGITLDQLVNPDKYHALIDLWESDAPPGERLQEYVDREWAHEPHQGETPPSIIHEVLDYSAKAVQEIDSADPQVTQNHEEYARLRNDVHCIAEMSQNYAAKANAAILVMRYAHSKDIADMEKAESFLADSLNHYRTLAHLTADTYSFANSMQTSQRRIPVSGGVGGKPANYHWTQLVSLYEKELATFHARVLTLQHGPATLADDSTIKPLPKLDVHLLSPDAQAYDVSTAAKVFTDQLFAIRSLAPEIAGLTGLRFSDKSARNGDYVPIEFETTQPVQVLIGYFHSTEKGWLQVPTLETDALAAEHIDTEPLIQNAATIDSCPAVDVYAMRFDAGKHLLEMRGKGSFIVLGFVPQSTQITKRDAHCPAGH